MNEFRYLQAITMAINIKINVTGDKQAIKNLNNISSNLAKPKVPLQNSSKIMMAAIMANFKNQGKTFGVGWKPLAQSTIKIKEQKGYGDMPPLVRTKAMKSGFRSSINKNTLIIDNPVPYFPKHQLGTSNNKPPQRVMLRIDKTRLHLIVDAFIDWVAGIIKKQSK